METQLDEEALLAEARRKRLLERQAFAEAEARRRGLSGASSSHSTASTNAAAKDTTSAVKFVSKHDRAALLRKARADDAQPAPVEEKEVVSRKTTSIDDTTAQRRQALLSRTTAVSKPTNTRASTGKQFKFDWDDTEDTTDADALLPDDEVEKASSGKSSNADLLLLQADRRSSHQAANFVHWSEKRLQDMVERDWTILKEDFDIKVKGPNPPHPARNWHEMGLPAAILSAVQAAGYVSPTPIQMQAIPIGISGRDMMGIAETGSGKTAAFAIPLLIHIDQRPNLRSKCSEEGPLALVLAPTRELVQQIEREIASLTSFFSEPARTVSIIGGTSVEQQAFRVREGVDVICGTPGRLIDILNERLCVLNQCAYFVLDEADTMIDLGFEPQVYKVMESLVVDSTQRTTFMFSATMPPSVEKLVANFMKPSPLAVYVGGNSGGKNRNIEQRVVVTTNKGAELLAALQRAPPGPVIVFCNEKFKCDIVASLIPKFRRVDILHGGKAQEQREASLARFKSGVSDVLVATDVAGRGLDVEGVALVVNYDAPTTLERYTHRIGRTGRAGKSGLAVTLLEPAGGSDDEFVPSLIKYLQETNQRIPPELKAHGGGPGRKRGRFENDEWGMRNIDA